MIEHWNALVIGVIIGMAIIKYKWIWRVLQLLLRVLTFRELRRVRRDLRRSQQGRED